MKNFHEWYIKEVLSHEGSEIYFEDVIGVNSISGVRTETQPVDLPAKKVYKVIDSNEEEGTDTLQDQHG